MALVIYYDENPTVRGIVEKILKNQGFSVKILDDLMDCQEALASTMPEQTLLIIDLSSKADKVKQLQEIIPPLLPKQEHCVLTTVNPAALAPYLPEHLEDTFFKHVVERPFKRLAFNDFILEISAQLAIRADSLIPWNPAAKTDAQMQRPKTPIDYPRPVTGSIPSSISEVVFKSRDVAVLAANDEEEEAESTDIISPDLTRELLASAGVDLLRRPQINPQLRHQVFCNTEELTDLYITIAKRRLSATLELKLDNQVTLLCFSFGQIRWAETFNANEEPSIKSFLTHLPPDPLIPVESLLALIEQNVSAESALSTLNLNEVFDHYMTGHCAAVLNELFKIAPQNINIYKPQYSPYEEFIAKRPTLSIPIAPILFEYYRKNSESLIAPFYLSNSIYIARQKRSPLNHLIRLNSNEEIVLRFLRAPLSHRELKARKIKNALDILYRLSLFDFIDECSPKLNQS